MQEISRLGKAFHEGEALSGRAVTQMSNPHLPVPLPPQRRQDATFRFGRCEVRPLSREVLFDGVMRLLQPKAFDLLLYLIANRERVALRDELLDAIWPDQVVGPGSLTASIMRIRRALSDPESKNDRIINTYCRIGYRFVAQLDSV